MGKLCPSTTICYKRAGVTLSLQSIKIFFPMVTLFSMYLPFAMVEFLSTSDVGSPTGRG